MCLQQTAFVLQQNNVGNRYHIHFRVCKPPALFTHFHFATECQQPRRHERTNYFFQTKITIQPKLQQTHLRHGMIFTNDAHHNNLIITRTSRVHIGTTYIEYFLLIVGCVVLTTEHF